MSQVTTTLQGAVTHVYCVTAPCEMVTTAGALMASQVCFQCSLHGTILQHPNVKVLLHVLRPCYLTGSPSL